LHYSDYRIRTPLKHPFSGEKQLGVYNLNFISANSKSVCSIWITVTPRFPNNVNSTNNQSIQRKTEFHTTFKT